MSWKCVVSVLDLVDACWYFFFFLQAEDGLRYLTVTGVQTCALPISRRERCYSPRTALRPRRRCATPASSCDAARSSASPGSSAPGGPSWCAHCSGSSPRRRSEEHTSELQSQSNLVCRLLLEKKKKRKPSL